MKMILGMMLSFNAVSGLCAPPDPVGILVMAHGGKPDWEAGFLASLESLKDKAALEVAFGMASAPSLQEAVRRLEERGSRRIAVVRVFVSGESFLSETRKILGLETGAPPRPAGADMHAHHHGRHDHGAASFWRVESSAAFALSGDGLMDSPEMGKVLAKRASGLSKDPARESVLILAHGPEDDGEDGRWKEKIGRLAGEIRRAGPFRDVRVETLREDWPDKRKKAERRIRKYVERGSKKGRVLVIPFRVHGFGPFAKVLSGLDYASDGQGLLPDPAVAEWIAAQAGGVARSKGWPEPVLDRQ